MKGMGKLLGRSILGVGILSGLILLPNGSHAQQLPGAPGGAIRYPIAGQPPLTFDMAQKATNFFSWVLDAPLTAEQRQHIQESLAESWAAGRQDDIRSALQIIQLNDQVTLTKTPTEREVIRQTLQPQFIAQMRAQANSDFALWVLGIYDAAHKPIASGNPPLTDKVVDAYVAYVSFLSYQAMGSTWSWKGPGSFHDAVAQPIIAAYPKMSAEQQAAMAQVPLQWAQLNDAWPKTPLAVRQQLCAQLRPAVQQVLDGLSQSAAAAAAAEPQGQPGSADQLAKKLNNQMMVNSFMASSMTKINTMITTGRPVF